MAIAKSRLTPESQLRWDGGQSTAVDADILPDHQTAKQKNVLITDGKPKPRFVLRELGLLPTGRIQGADIYEARGKIILSVEGQIWRVNLSGFNMDFDQIKLSQRNSSNQKQVWMKETPSAFLIQDGQSNCIIYDGASARRANPDNGDVPRGTVMEYGNGRLAVATSIGVAVGDVYLQYQKGSELRFTEDDWWYQGGQIGMPSQPIGMRFLPLNDTTTGAGSLMVIGDRWTKSIGLDNRQRSTWQSDSNFVTRVFGDIGGVSNQSMVTVNQDIWWINQFGELRSLRYAALDQQSAGHTSQSKEMSDVMTINSPEDLYNASGIYFKDQLLMTAQPYVNIHGGISYKSLMSLNFSSMSTMRSKAPPAFNGEWEGVEFNSVIAGRVNGRRRAFALSTDQDGHNRLWEFVPNEFHDSSYRMDVDDTTASLRNSRIKWQIETRKFFHGANDQMDELESMDIYLSKMRENVDVTVYYRPDYSKQWVLWGTKSFDAKVSNKDTPLNAKPQGRSDVGYLKMPEADYNDMEKRHAYRGYGFQYKLEIDGYAQLDRIISRTKVWNEFNGANDEAIQTETYLHSVTDNDVRYEIPVGGIVYYKDEDGEIYKDDRGIGYGERPPSASGNSPSGNPSTAKPISVSPGSVLSTL